MTDTKTVFIVSHTHWDREWYLPFHQFRVNQARILERIFTALETDPSFRHFVLDGQAIILEDHLSVYPENQARLQKLIAVDRLSIGPWYILPDEFLVSAEATVRNLLIGHQVCSGMGRVQKVGYMPDSFGHLAQIPQILRLAGIDSFIYTRGNGDELDELGNEFIWTAPDGSEVLAINQCGGYCNASALGFQEIWEAHTRRSVNIERAIEQIKELLAKINRFSNGSIYLFNNGCDHFPPQQNFGEILSALRQEFPNHEFIHCSFDTYLQAVKAAGLARKKYSGELLGGKYHFILTGVWSARMYLKQQNDRAQTLLEKYLEPLSVYSHFALGQPYPQQEIRSAWKLLLQNHPHDSICGCSIDKVHQEMLPRFAGVQQIASQVIRHQLEHIAPLFAGHASNDRQVVLTVFNPSPWRRSEVVERLLILPKGLDIEQLALFDANNQPVPFRIPEKKYIEGFWGIDYGAELFCEQQREFFKIYLEQFGARIIKPETEKEQYISFVILQFHADDLPALGHRVYYLRDRSANFKPAGPGQSVRVTADTIENEFYWVQLHANGTMDVLDKQTGQRFEGLNRLEDTEDIGDEYDYSACEKSQALYSDDLAGELRILENTGSSATLEAKFNFPLPVEINPDRKSRSQERILCPVRVRVSLKYGQPGIQVITEFDNRARDHRLRAHFKSPIKTDTIISDGHFYINHRPILQTGGPDWVQEPAGTWPQCDFSLVQDGKIGLAIFNQGLPEIAALQEPDGTATLALTLVRAVGWLSRDDFSARKGNAGPTIFTPDAQCPGWQRFDYAIMPFGGDFLAAKIKAASQQYKNPLLVKQGVADGHIPDGFDFIQKSSDLTAISALKKHEERDTLVLRLYNLSAEKLTETVTFGKKLAGAWVINLLEERVAALEIKSPNQLELGLRPCEIISVEIDLV